MSICLGRLLLLLTLLGFMASGCADPRTTHERLNNALWTQSSVEHDFTCEQIYRLARIQLDAALRDPDWTAALEQTGDVAALPPAVILDLDETVLDNSAFSARLVVAGVGFQTEPWRQWVQEAQAEAIPGAREFVAYAQSRKVAVFFVTNREVAGEGPTVENLKRIVDPTIEGSHVLSRGEKASWTSDKSSRRKYIAATHRILLLIGDDFNDFTTLGNVSPSERVRLGSKYADLWGTRWIMIPNNNYGSWQSAVWGYDFALSDAEKLRLQREALQTRP